MRNMVSHLMIIRLELNIRKNASQLCTQIQSPVFRGIH